MSVSPVMFTDSEATFDRCPRRSQCELMTERLSRQGQVRLGCAGFGGTPVLQSPGELADARSLPRDGGGRSRRQR